MSLSNLESCEPMGYHLEDQGLPKSKSPALTRAVVDVPNEGMQQTHVEFWQKYAETVPQKVSCVERYNRSCAKLG